MKDHNVRHVGTWAGFLERRNGFTLIEIIIVVVIICVLAILMIFVSGKSRMRGRDAKRIATINQIYEAIILYKQDNGYLPETIAKTELQPYLPNIPTQGYTDPLTNKLYHYGTNSDVNDTSRTKYQLWAELEQTSSVLAGDDDIDGSSYTLSGTNSSGEPKGIDASDPATTEACVTTNTFDCIYDVGIR